jgi:4-amino-4-deoxy-L-arabinose transferase-like glycosyltransferase
MKGAPATRGIAAVLGGAALMRVIYLLDYRARSVFWDAMLLDARVYDEWARSLMKDWTGGAEVYALPPLYPYFLAALYTLAGPHYAAVYVAQAAMGVLNIWLVYAIGRRVFGGETPLIAAVMAALYGSFMFMESKLMSTTLAITLGLVLLRLLLAASERPALWRWAACGALLGLTALARPETLLLAPLVAWWIHRLPGPKQAARPAKGERERGAARWAPVAVFAASAALLVAPATARNWIVSGDWSLANLISSQAGITFYQSNNPDATGLYSFLQDEGFSGNAGAQAREEKALAEKATGRPMKRSEVTRYWMNRGLSWIVSNPGPFLVLETKKLLRFLGTYEYSTEYIFHVERRSVPSLWLGFLPFAAITSLAVVGILFAWREAWKPPVLLLAIFVLANLAAVLAFYVSSRYRMPSAPALILFAAHGVERLARGFRSRLGPDRTEAWIHAVIAGVLFLVFHAQVDRTHIAQEGNVHYNAGVLHYNKKQYAESVREYREALDVDARNWRAWYNLGNSYSVLKQRDDAVAAYRQALDINPDFEQARARLRALQAEPGP